MGIEIEHIIGAAVTLTAGGMGGTIIAFFNWMRHRGEARHYEGSISEAIEYLKQDALHNREEHREMRRAISDLGTKVDTLGAHLDRRVDYIENTLSQIKKEWK